MRTCSMARLSKATARATQFDRKEMMKPLTRIREWWGLLSPEAQEVGLVTGILGSVCATVSAGLIVTHPGQWTSALAVGCSLFCIGMCASALRGFGDRDRG